MRVVGSSVYLAHTAGPLLKLDISVTNDEVTAVSVSFVQTIPTVVTCMAYLRYDNHDFMFMGSESSHCLLFDLSTKRVVDTLKNQTSAQCLHHIIDSAKGNYLMYAHGYVHPLLPDSSRSNAIVTARTSDVCERIISFEVPDSHVVEYRLVRSLRWKNQFDNMIVLSSDSATKLLYLEKTTFSMMSAEKSPLLLNTRTIEVALMDAALWGGNAGEQVIVQVYDFGIRVSNGTQVICEVKQQAKIR